MAAPRVRTAPNRQSVFRVKTSAQAKQAQQSAREFMTTGLYEFASATLIDANEIEAKKRPPNTPSAFYAGRRVQGLKPSDAKKFLRPNTDTSEVMIGEYGTWKKIGLIYGANLDVYEAVKFVYHTLLKVLPTDTGYSRKGILFVGVNRETKRTAELRSLGAVRSWLQAQGGDRTTVQVVGPTVPYRRKMMYGAKKSPEKKQRALAKNLRGTAVDRIVGFENPADRGLKQVQSRGKRIRVEELFTVRQAIHKLVVRRARSQNKYKGIWFQYAYLRSKEELQPDRKGKWYKDRLQGTGPYGGVPVIFVAGSLQLT